MASLLPAKAGLTEGLMRVRDYTLFRPASGSALAVMEAGNKVIMDQC